MRRIGICCAISLLMFVGVGRAAPIGQHGSASSAGAPTVLLLGARAIDHGVGQISSGHAEAFPLAVRRAGSVSAVSLYVDARSTAKSLEVALYSSRSGSPVRRVASGVR